MKRPVIVQRYLADPFLINGSKFDLRVYVYISSYDPLCIYVLKEGLARFATCKYSSAMKHLSNRYMHLTNYSINKRNSEFTPNTDEKVCQGHKWGLLALWGYMRTEMGVDTDAVWQSITDLVIKTIIWQSPGRYHLTSEERTKHSAFVQQSTSQRYYNVLLGEFAAKFHKSPRQGIALLLKQAKLLAKRTSK